MRSVCGRPIPKLSAMIRVRRPPCGIRSEGGISVIEPVQSNGTSCPLQGTISIPGSRSSTGTVPSAVAISVPCAKAEKADSNIGIAGPI